MPGSQPGPMKESDPKKSEIFSSQCSGAVWKPGQVRADDLAAKRGGDQKPWEIPIIKGAGHVHRGAVVKGDRTWRITGTALKEYSSGNHLDWNLLVGGTFNRSASASKITKGRMKSSRHHPVGYEGKKSR